MSIAAILLKHRVLGRDQAEQFGSPTGRLDQFVVQRGHAREIDVLKALAHELTVPFVELRDRAIDPELFAVFPTREIFARQMLPIERRGKTIVVATSDILDLEPLRDLAAITGLTLEPVAATSEDIGRVIKERLGVGGGTLEDLVARRDDTIEVLDQPGDADGNLDELAQQASIVKLVNELLLDALQQGASDIHLEPEEHSLTVRYRVDGLLRVEPVAAEINQFRAAIISRVKIMARLNIAEKRLPQDGRITLRLGGREIDVRVSVIPMMYGEGIVLRLLDKGRQVFDLRRLTMPAEVDATFRRLITLPHGILLVTGPTGSGKTTTLYSALAEIRSPAVKIITIEDPVEYSLPGIRQIQTHARVGLTFAAGLRSVLRHDPDVILVGEIRDAETAHSAIQAALTGHLVLSTLHTNDSPTAFTRLVDMGVEPYLVASTVEAVLAQRLLRRLCPRCKTETAVADDLLPPDFPQPRPTRLFQPGKCRECRDTGYSGRQAIFELLRADSRVRQLCTERASADAVRRQCLGNGLVTLRQRGWELVRAGETSVGEVLRVCGRDES